MVERSRVELDGLQSISHVLLTSMQAAYGSIDQTMLAAAADTVDTDTVDTVDTVAPTALHTVRYGMLHKKLSTF